jgi:hypothetical protein
VCPKIDLSSVTSFISTLRRWDGKAYDFGLLMGILDLILGSMDLESVIEEEEEEGSP